MGESPGKCSQIMQSYVIISQIFTLRDKGIEFNHNVTAYTFLLHRCLQKISLIQSHKDPRPNTAPDALEPSDASEHQLDQRKAPPRPPPLTKCRVCREWAVPATAAPCRIPGDTIDIIDIASLLTTIEGPDN